MKKIISLKKRFYEIKDIKWVSVPLYDELRPSNVINAMKLKENYKEDWELLIDLCPELNYKNKPKDREFFFNVLNTLIPNSIDRIVRNSFINRQQKSKIEDEIEVAPRFRSIFTDELSILGSKGRTIKELRKDHREKKTTYNKRK